MEDLKHFTSEQLEKMLSNTKAEIKRRETIQAAAAEIQIILNKYGISLQDVDLLALDKQTALSGGRTKTTKTKSHDMRKRVKPKYAKPNGVESWSGRGRAPVWVSDLCESEGIDLATFKKDSRFIKN